MDEIEPDRIWTIRMFSKKGWEEVNKRVPASKYRWGDPEDLHDGFMEYADCWMEDNEYDFDYLSPEEIRGEKMIFYCQTRDKHVFFRGDFEDTLLTRYSEYLLGD